MVPGTLKKVLVLLQVVLEVPRNPKTHVTHFGTLESVQSHQSVLTNTITTLIAKLVRILLVLGSHLVQAVMAVEKEYVEEQLAKLNSKKRLGVGKELKHLHEVINKGENILGHTRGFYNGNTWLVCITDRRIIFLDKGMIYGMKQTEIPLKNVSAVNYETGMLKKTI